MKKFRKHWKTVSYIGIRYLVPLFAYPIAIVVTYKADFEAILKHVDLPAWLDVAQIVAASAIGLAFIAWLYRTVAAEIYNLVMPQRNTNDSETRRIANAIAVVIFFGILAILSLLLFDFFGHVHGKGVNLSSLARLEKEEMTKIGGLLGTFGDFFGGVLNPILTFLTFIALAITMVMQRIQLKENSELSRLQTFETTFFNMLNLHNTSVQDLQYDPSVVLMEYEKRNLDNRQRVGRALIVPEMTEEEIEIMDSLSQKVNFANKSKFSKTKDDLQNLHGRDGKRAQNSQRNMPDLKGRDNHVGYAAAISSATSPDGRYAGNSSRDSSYEGRQVFAEVLRTFEQKSLTTHKAQPVNVYRKIQNEHNYIFGRYFRNLYQILDFIDQYASRFVHEVESADLPGKRYTDILRAQLSSSELLILFYNCHEKMVDDGEFRELLKKYEFLEHMSVLTLSKASIGVPGYGFDITPMLRQYFYEDESGEVEAPGAFGKNPVIEEYLIENFNYAAVVRV